MKGVPPGTSGVQTGKLELGGTRAATKGFCKDAPPLGGPPLNSDNANGGCPSVASGMFPECSSKYTPNPPRSTSTGFCVTCQTNPSRGDTSPIGVLENPAYQFRPMPGGNVPLKFE